MEKLTEAEIKERLGLMEGWAYVGGKLSRSRQFNSFPSAIEFVNRVAELAEAQNHHPDIEIHYTLVRLGLNTHDAGGVTQRDFKLARAISELEV